MSRWSDKPDLRDLPMIRWIHNLAVRIHRDERGNLGILLLMCIVALSALIGFVWNTGEYVTRRRHAQLAADAAAHGAALWTSRTTNLVSATNMLISENGSAQVIWSAVSPTATSIEKRLNNERANAQRLLYGTTVGTPERNIPDMEYWEELLGFGPWAGRSRGQTLLTTLASVQTDLNRRLCAGPAVPGGQPAQPATGPGPAASSTDRRGPGLG
jgi:hypothetical protein